MEATSLSSSYSSSSLILRSLFPSQNLHSQKRKFCGVVSAAGRDPSCYGKYYRGQLVDESMIVLRKRMHEMKMIERNYEPPAEWMDWEKQYYTSYDEFICKFVGFLQSQLMNTRPSLALGLLALVAVSVPASTFMVVVRLLEAVNGVMSAVHLHC